MDNKQDRNFYWNIKDFMSKPHNPVMPQINPKNIKESINGVLNQNAVYKTTNFQSNITSARHISQAISAVERNNQKGTPDNIGNTKNITSNPFGVVNEGIFDDPIGALKSYGKAFVDGVKGVAEWGHGNNLGSGETTQYSNQQRPETQAQAQQQNINVKNMSAKTLTPEQQKFEQSTSVPTTGDPNDPGDDSDDSDIRGDQEDRDTPKATPAGTPPPPPPSDTPTDPAAQTQNSSGEDVSDKIDAQRKAYGMRKGDGDGGGKAGAAERTAARRARSDAIRDANIALRSTPEGEKTFRQQKANRSTTQGNITQADIALRYAKPGQRVADTQSPEETARIADEFVASQKEGRKPNYQATTPAPAAPAADEPAAEEPNQPGYDPSKKQYSTRDGTIHTIEEPTAPAGTIPTTAAPAPATPQRAMDSLGQGSLPNNSGGMQNAKQPEPAPAEDDDVKPGDFWRKDGSRGNINTPAPAAPAPAGTIPTPAAPAPAENDDVKDGDFSRRDGSRGNINTPAPAAPAPAGKVPNTAAWSPSSGGPAIPESDAGNTELQDRMRNIKQSGDRTQPKEYKEMETELNRRTDGDVKDGDFSRRDGSRGNINTPNSTRDQKIQTVNSKIAKMTATPKTSLA